jgi:Zn-dependent protease
MLVLAAFAAILLISGTNFFIHARDVGPDLDSHSSLLISLERLYSNKTNWPAVVAMLLVSGGLFFVLGMQTDPLANIIILIGVLFIHELGHFVAMQALGYNDVRILFIPFFGAVTGGQDSQPSGAKKAIVALLGPVPGLIFALAFLLLAARNNSDRCLLIGQTFLWLNLFNLLPAFPLDGGQLLDAILFSRNKKLELTFKFLASVALGALAVILKEPILGFLAAGVFFRLRTDYKLASIAESSKEEIPEPDRASPRIPEQYLRGLVTQLGSYAPATAGGRAAYLLSIWERMRSVPPSRRAAAAVLSSYLVAIVFGAVVIGVQAAVLQGTGITEKIENRQMADGSWRKCSMTYQHGRLVAWAALGEDGLFDGPAEAYYPGTNKVDKRGQWKSGRLTGEWTSFDSQGEQESEASFVDDQLVWEKSKESGWKPRTWEQLSKAEQEEYPRRPGSPPQRTSLDQKSASGPSSAAKLENEPTAH